VYITEFHYLSKRVGGLDWHSSILHACVYVQILFKHNKDQLYVPVFQLGLELTRPYLLSFQRKIRIQEPIFPHFHRPGNWMVYIVGALSQILLLVLSYF
jgi:hypothetical protein